MIVSLVQLTLIMILQVKLDVNHVENSLIHYQELPLVLVMENSELLENLTLLVDAYQDMYSERKMEQLKGIMYLKIIVFHSLMIDVILTPKEEVVVVHE